MLLSDRDIRSEIQSGRVAVEPFDEAMIQPSSVDVRLDKFFRVFENHKYSVIDPSIEQAELTREVIAEDDEAGQEWCEREGYPGYTSYASLDDLPWRAPIFADLQKALDFFTDILGFAVPFRQDGYAYIHRETVGFRLLEAEEEQTAAGRRRFAYYIDVRDVDALYAELKPKLVIPIIIILMVLKP